MVSTVEAVSTAVDSQAAVSQVAAALLEAAVPAEAFKLR